MFNQEISIWSKIIFIVFAVQMELLCVLKILRKFNLKIKVLEVY